MARGVNKVILIGNLGRDPEVRYMPDGGAVVNVTIATSESWKDKNTGDKVERTEWHRVVFYRRLAEIVAEYLKKGAKIYVEGRLQTRKWQDQNGVERYTTEIIAQDMQMLDTRAAGGVQPQTAAPPQAAAPAGHGQAPVPETPATSAPQQTAMAQTASGGGGDFDDDIPFRQRHPLEA